MRPVVAVVLFSLPFSGLQIACTPEEPAQAGSEMTTTGDGQGSQNSQSPRPIAAASPEAVVLFDLQGQEIRPLAEPAGPASVYLFVRTDCPISNRYAPEIRRLADLYAERGIATTLVYPSADESADAIRQHLDDFGFSRSALDALRDSDRSLVAHTGAEVTPEAAVFDSRGNLAYRGRIDDTYVSFSNQRAEPTRRDLVLTLDALLAGEAPPSSHQPAVGCAIPTN